MGCWLCLLGGDSVDMVVEWDAGAVYAVVEWDTGAVDAVVGCDAGAGSGAVDPIVE